MFFYLIKLLYIIKYKFFCLKFFNNAKKILLNQKKKITNI